jgi:hypothetical protein
MKEEARIRRIRRAKTVPLPEDSAVLRPCDHEIRDHPHAQVIPLFSRAARAESVVGSNDRDPSRARPWPSAERAQELAARGRRFLEETKPAETYDDVDASGR